MSYEFADVFKSGFIGLLTENNINALSIAVFIALAVVSYLLGSLNFALILSKFKYKEDIRDYGSSNAGATNVLRRYGKFAAVITFLGDGVKTLIASLVFGRLTFGLFGAYIAGIFCLIGHAKPIFFGFKGGKGVTVTAFSVLATNPLTFAFVLAIFVIVMLCTRIVSFSSVTAALFYPIILSFMYGKDLCTVIAVLMSIFVIYLHRENLERLSRGEEKKLVFGKKKDIGKQVAKK